MTTLDDTLGKLVAKSREGFYNPYVEFDWPDSVAEDAFWMSPELLSIHGSAFSRGLDAAQLTRLSHFEALHFFSLNVHGIKDLIHAVMDVIYTSEFDDCSRYFHHFIAEENTHMWFFAEFCQRYGHKIYPQKEIRFDTDQPAEINHLVVFSRIYILERIVAYFNRLMAEDERLAPIVRKINRVHFLEESRHIAMGEALIRKLVEAVAEKFGAERLADVGAYLSDYARYCVTSFYNPSVYRDAGLAEPYELRRQLLDDPARRAFNDMLFEQGTQYFPRLGVSL